MKNLIIVFVVSTFLGCGPEPEFYIGGKPFYTNTYCANGRYESKWGWHYGYNPLSGKFQYHYGHYTEYECEEYKTDTLEIK